jgi:hypothetical protein
VLDVDPERSISTDRDQAEFRGVGKTELQRDETLV